MLRQLRATSFALIEDVCLDFPDGLSVLTGETGAGKTLVLSALSLVLGERGSAALIRAGEEKAKVQAVFEVAGDSPVSTILREAGIDADDGNLVIRREITSGGKSRAWINDTPSTVGLLAALGDHLVDLHGQHEHQSLLRPQVQRDALDSYAGAEAQRRAVAEARKAYAAALSERDEMARQVEAARDKADLVAFQLEEIVEADPKPGEMEELRGEEKRLANAEHLAAAAGEAYQTLYDGERSISAGLSSLAKALSRLADLDTRLAALTHRLETMAEEAADLSEELRSYRDGIDSEPGRLEQAQDRLHLLKSLCRKHGGSLDAVLARREELQVLADRASVGGEELAELNRRLDREAEALCEACRKLSARRERWAKKLARAVEDELAGLGMGEAEVRVTVRAASPGKAESATPEGWDDVEFLVAANPGEGEMPLARVASGGEISRVMLALRAVLARSARVPVLVFDEIDANVGGRLGDVVAEKLKEVASHHQVIAISHLPQIAARADRHIQVAKETVGGRTRTSAEPLEGPERLEELARMLGGRRPSKAARAHAEQLLGTGR